MDETLKMTADEGAIEDNLGEQEAIPFVRYSITSYGADYTVDSLVSRLQKKSIYIPSFQRDFVWKPQQSSHLIESLLLGLPVPGIFLSKDEKERLLVVDGQQRLRTLQAFYEGKFPDGNEFKLVDVQKEFEGKTYETLEDEDRLRLDDSIIRATILQQNAPREDFGSSIYFIFRRLNTNTTPLTPQEIRAAIYEGELNDLLIELDKNDVWRSIVRGFQVRRKRGQELILRFFTMFYYSKDYPQYRSMDDFLTRFMQRFEDADESYLSELRNLFLSTLTTINNAIGPVAFKRKWVPKGEKKVATGPFNAAVFDAIMIGVARRLQKGEIGNVEAFKQSYLRLLENEDFQLSTQVSTGNPESVSRRIELSTIAFSDLE